MIGIRIAKITMIVALAAYALIVAYDNIVDYGSNYEFVSHVLSMDTTFEGNQLKHRAISNETMWRAAYVMIIAVEALTSLLLALGALALVRRLRAPADIFNKAKVWSVAGLVVGFGLWFGGFLVIAGEYFAMWQSKDWNAQQASFRFYVTVLAALIFLNMQDGELKERTGA